MASCVGWKGELAVFIHLRQGFRLISAAAAVLGATRWISQLEAAEKRGQGPARADNEEGASYLGQTPNEMARAKPVSLGRRPAATLSPTTENRGRQMGHRRWALSLETRRSQQEAPPAWHCNFRSAGPGGYCVDPERPSASLMTRHCGITDSRDWLPACAMISVTEMASRKTDTRS